MTKPVAGLGTVWRRRWRAQIAGLTVAAGCVCLLFFRFPAVEEDPSEPRPEPEQFTKRERVAAGAGVSRSIESGLAPRRGPDPAQAGPMTEAARRAIISGEWVAFFGDTQAMEAFAREAQARGWAIIGRLPRQGALRLRFSPQQSGQVRRAVEEWGGSVDYNYRSAAPPAPGAKIVGDLHPVGDRAAALIGAGAGLDRSRWGTGIKVAVLDTACASESIASGKTVQRINVTEGDGSAGLHGTAVAALLAGDTAHWQGIAPAAQLVQIQVVDAEGAGDTFTLAAGIYAALEAGARIINISLGTPGDATAVRLALAAAERQGAVIVAATGNDGASSPLFPAAYDGIVSVAAVDAMGQRAPFSNMGESIALAAPGVGVQAPDAAGGTILFSGTSASAPLVSGSLAALLSEEPHLTGAEAVRLLEQYANDTGAPGQDAGTGHGIVDLERVLKRSDLQRQDAALAGAWIDPIRSDAESLAVVLSVQNRGNTALNSQRLQVIVQGRPAMDYYTPPLAPGAVSAQEVRIPRDLLGNASGPPVVIEAALAPPPGQPDTRPDNDARMVTIGRP